MRRLASLAAGAAAIVVAATASAAAGEPVDDPQEFSGNVTTCEDVEAVGVDWDETTQLDETIVEGTISNDGTVLNVELLNDDWIIVGVIVKGGPNYNVYVEPPFENMVSPLNGGGNIPQISHWFACGVLADTPPTEPPPTQPPTEEPPTEEPPTEAPPTEAPPTEEPPAETETPAPSPSETGDELPDTGLSPSLLLVFGLTLVGGAALALRHKFVS